jgi:hypothetical protein
VADPDAGDVGEEVAGWGHGHFYSLAPRLGKGLGNSKVGLANGADLLALKRWRKALFACLPSTGRIKLWHAIVHQGH